MNSKTVLAFPQRFHVNWVIIIKLYLKKWKITATFFVQLEAPITCLGRLPPQWRQFCHQPKELKLMNFICNTWTYKYSWKQMTICNWEKCQGEKRVSGCTAQVRVHYSCSTSFTYRTTKSCVISWNINSYVLCSKIKLTIFFCWVKDFQVITIFQAYNFFEPKPELRQTVFTK